MSRAELTLTTALLTLGLSLAPAAAQDGPLPTPAPLPPSTVNTSVPPPSATGSPPQPLPAPPPVYGQPLPVAPQPLPGPGTEPPGESSDAQIRYAVPVPPWAVGNLPSEVVQVVKSYQTKPRYSLIIGGGVAFGGLYMLTALPLTLATNDMKMAIPIAGPWVMAAGLANHSTDVAAKFWLAVDGIGQAAMLGLFIAGLATKQRTPVYERMMLLPSLSAGGAGMTAVGRF